MKTIKKLGIWIDHSYAHLIEFATDPITMKVVSGQFTHQEKEQQQAAYYKELGEIIKGYQDVLLFGPTSAKTELFNVLRADRHFENIKLETKDEDKMTENEQQAFVRDYFSHEL